MRTYIAALALSTVACSWSQASAAEAGFSDVICPEATQYVVSVGKLRRDDPPQRIYDAAQAATDAYQRCSKDKLSNGFREAQHYADTRGSSFAVLAARALVALNRPEDARRELELWRPLAQQVVDWQSETQTSVQGHKPAGDDPTFANVTAGDHRKSMYHDSAKEIVSAIDAEVAHIDTLLRDRPRTQGHATPAPVPSTTP
ncbi:MAG TPA: hypothetical protein VE826_02965 [Dongiaceae bacterium]|nr:hypothetical protein [Dongiaceae bacterium]